MAGFLFLYIQFTLPGPLEYKRHLIIPKGLSVKQIAKYLEKEKVIHNHLIFQAGILVFRHSHQLRAGEFEFEPRLSAKDTMNILLNAPFVRRKLTIIEGTTLQQIQETLGATEGLVGETPLSQLTEGVLYPDTYYFHYGDSKQKLVEQMRQKMQTTLDELWVKRDTTLPLKTKRDALILASIIERETGYHNEKPKIAAVFYNRLNKGMRLQSDPTVIYGLSKGYGKLDRELLRVDYKHQSEFNTYQINGLPPTPISNPGLDSLKAVFYPAKTTDYYFVADGKGGHIFAKTLDEHNKNVQAYLKIKKENAAQASEKQPEDSPTQ